MPTITPLDPDSPAGKAATEALGDAVASVTVSVAARRAAAKSKAGKRRPVAAKDAA